MLNFYAQICKMLDKFIFNYLENHLKIKLSSFFWFHKQLFILLLTGMSQLFTEKNNKQKPKIFKDWVRLDQSFK